MVGTAFVHALANAYSAFCRTTLSIEIEPATPGGALPELIVCGEMKHTLTSWGAKIDVGPVLYGQSRDIVLQIVPTSSGNTEQKVKLTASLAYDAWTADATSETVTASSTISYGADPAPPIAGDDHQQRRDKVLYHVCRSELVSIVADLFRTATAKESNTLIRGTAQSKPRQLYATLTNTPADNTQLRQGDISREDSQKAFTALANLIRARLPSHTEAEALMVDIAGEIVMAVSNAAHYQRWGRHYLLAVSHSHQRQLCGNFKDPGLQVYGSESVLFNAARDEIDAMFDALPPPKVSERVIQQVRAQGQTYRAPVSMQQWNMRAGPCFVGASLVRLADDSGGVVEARLLRRGMRVWTPAGPMAIAAVLKTHIQTGELPLCKIGGGLLITPWHPVVSGHTWVFPADIASPEMTQCDAIYSLLLEPADDPDAHQIVVDGVMCVTLGHGVADAGDVRAHAFLGDYNAIAADLRLAEHVEGVVNLAGVRRGAEGTISGFVPADVFQSRVATVASAPRDILAVVA